jgi:pimeloyl-ACP methyl ester carboxylesterase
MAISPLPLPPLWRESRLGLEAAALFRSRVFKGDGVADAEGQPVLLIPGFLAGDDSLGVMTQWLRRTGHRTKSAGIRSNIDCSSASVERLAERLECLVDSHGQRVAIIGQSRGGNFAKVLAVRHPELVSGIVTLGSPTVSQLSVHPFVLAQVALVGALGSGRVPGMFTWRCLRGECCSRFRDDLAGPFPPEVGYVALYSKTDGIVDWHACLDPAAECVEVRASHIGMGLNAQVYAEVAHALAGFADDAVWAAAA